MLVSLSRGDVVASLPSVSAANGSRDNGDDPTIQAQAHDSGQQVSTATTTPRNEHYSGSVVKEKKSGKGLVKPVATTTTLSPDMQAFVDQVCTDPTQFFDQPTDIPACGNRGSVATPRPRGLGQPSPERAEAERYVVDYLKLMALERPRPEISAKQGGICGVEHSLDLHMRTERIFEDSDAPYGTLDVHAYAAVKVNWGDGQSGTYYNGGAPWPKSQIVHAWQTRGYYDIDVNATWSASWSMGPYSGIIVGVPATGSIEDFRVWEIQAVITS